MTISAATSGFLPPALVDAIKGQLITSHKERRTRAFSVEYWTVRGKLLEARVRTHGGVITFSLST